MVAVHADGVDGPKGVVVTGLVKDDVVVAESQAKLVPPDV